MSSSTKRGFSPSVPVGTDSKKPPPNANNGSGPPPLKYSTQPVDDVNMNEVIDEHIELTVILPGGKTSQITVDSNIPMQDLRVLLAAKNKVSPTGYILNVFSEETGKVLDYKANQTIGSLEGRTIQLVSKHKEKDVEKIKSLKRESTSKLQPFETTHRFTINLPRNQKMVMRISPEMNLNQLYSHVCKEKHLDPRRFAFQHPTNPQFKLDMGGPVADIKSTEINLIPLGLVADSARSMPDLSRSESLTLPRDSFPSYMPGSSEPKKKRGLFSFLKKKDNKFKLHETKYYDMETNSNGSTQNTLAHARQSAAPALDQHPAESASAASAQVRPKSMFVTAKELQVHEESMGKDSTLPRAPPKKKRPAPPPPLQQKTIPETVEISVKDKTSTVQVHVHVKETETVAKSTPDHVTQRLHSRNSSDSSGYHELTLSGAESPEASRVSTNFKTSIDTTSIESADNTNGDSGINEHLPVHSSPKHRDMSAGDSKTLPLPRGNKKAVQRSHSLEKKEKANKAPPPSTKKRRAPAPPPAAVGGPPQPPPSSSDSPSHTPEASQDLTLDTSRPQPSHHASEETAVPISTEDEIDGQINDVVLNDFDHDDDSIDINETLDGLMMMVEDASIASEDIDNIEQPKAQRPCSFVAPPPPSEPPPPQTPEAETVDVGVEVHDNASLGPPSVKNSPVAAHSRTESQSSISSVNTIEDINLAFEQTIAMAEEVLESEVPAESGYKTEMAMFVERMSKLTEKADSETNISDTTSISLPDTESNSETGSVIRHEHDGRLHHAKVDSYSSDSGSVQKYDSEDRYQGEWTDAGGGLSSSYDDTHIPEPVPNRVRRDSLELHRENSTANNEVSEIDVPVETLLPPPEFRNEPEIDEDEKKEEEEEEEYRESTEEIIVTLPASSSFTFGGTYKIPDYETPKEHSGLPDSPRSRSVDQSLVYSTFEINDKPAHVPEPAPQVAEKPKPPRVKEEFVLTRDDLAKIKYIDDSKWKHSRVQPAKRPASLDTSHMTQVYQSGRDPVVSYASYQASYPQEEMEGNSIGSEQEDNVKSRCSELSFRPDSEGEIDNVLEEKSISMIALPAMRTSVLRKSDSEHLDSLKQDSYKTSTSVVLNTMSDEDRQMRNKFFEDDTDVIVQAKPVYIADNTVDTVEKVESSANDEEDDDLKKQQAALHAQYDILQQQFSMWQQQLEQNQKLLASQHIDPEVQNIQQMQAQQMQMQMQMQQQMMTQLQKSMDALSLQQKSKAELAAVNAASASVIAESTRPSGGSGSVPVPASASVFTPPPPPPLVPATQVLKTAVKGDKPSRQNDPRFERKLDPREELMIAIRTFGERAGLKKVPIQQTHWHAGSS